MTKIATADNLIINIQPGRWQLAYVSNNGTGQTPRIILEATPEAPLRYVSSYAQRRRLPDMLNPVDVRHVVLGWSEMDESWHLGLLLTPELAQQRGSRWCEIARWHDPDIREYAQIAEQSAVSLAQTIDRPFKLIPPRRDSVATRELPALALDVGMWTLREADNGLHLVRTSSWMMGRVTRLAWYGLWAIIYIILSVATLTTDLALPNSGVMLPNPELLPYLGIVVALILVGLVFSIAYDILTNPGLIVIDNMQRTVTALTGGRPKWQIARQDLQGVYVSQVVGQRGYKRTIYHGELNMQLTDDSFRNLMHLRQEEERTMESDDRTDLRENVMPLTVNEADTNLQAAGIYIAQALGVDCYYDQRVS